MLFHLCGNALVALSMVLVSRRSESAWLVATTGVGELGAAIAPWEEAVTWTRLVLRNYTDAVGSRWLEALAQPGSSCAGVAFCEEEVAVLVVIEKSSNAPSSGICSSSSKAMFMTKEALP